MVSDLKTINNTQATEVQGHETRREKRKEVRGSASMDAKTRVVNESVGRSSRVKVAESAIQNYTHKTNWGAQRRPRIKVSSKRVVRSSWVSAEMMVEGK